MSDLENLINEAFDTRAEIDAGEPNKELKDAVESVIWKLDSGELRVAEKVDGEWTVNQWLKKAVLLSFILDNNVVIQGGVTNYFDKIPNKFYGYNKTNFIETGARVVPNAVVRRGSFIAQNVVLMPIKQPEVSQVLALTPALIQKHPPEVTQHLSLC